MSLQVEKLEKNMAKLTIEVSAEDLDLSLIHIQMCIRDRSYTKNKKRIKDHIQYQTKEVCLQWCFGIALGCEKTCQHLGKEGKQDQSAGCLLYTSRCV